MRDLADASGIGIVPPERYKSVNDTICLAKDTVVVTYALYRLLMTIPAQTVSALRVRATKELVTSLQDKLAKQQHKKREQAVEKAIGKSLWARLQALAEGSEFPVLDFRKPMPVAATEADQSSA